jgi:ABC-type multidrug transport system ATPase subunit
LYRSGDLLKGSRIRVNGEVGRLPKRMVGVVWQDDLLLSNLTVEENIWYAARLKTPESITDAQVRELVHDTMKELGLYHIRHAVVGNPLAGIGVRGISGGERKRVSVAAELVVRPSLLLLDEPTSGLDATTAQALMVTLKELAGRGHSIVTVIHQPRTAIFNLIDHLVLLSKGHIIYQGESAQARSYLESCPTVPDLPPETGIADWIMDVIKEDEAREEGPMLATYWKEYSTLSSHMDGQGSQHGYADIDASGYFTAASEGVNSATVAINGVAAAPRQRHSSIKTAERRLSSLQELHAAPKFTTRFSTQLKLLTQRTMKQQRGERLTMTALSLQLAYLLFTALFW